MYVSKRLDKSVLFFQHFLVHACNCVTMVTTHIQLNVVSGKSFLGMLTQVANIIIDPSILEMSLLRI